MSIDHCANCSGREFPTVFVDGVLVSPDADNRIQITTGASAGSTGLSAFTGPVDNGDGTATFTHSDGAATPATFDLVVPLACSISGGNGLTGTQSGAFVDGCQTPDLGGVDPTAAGYDPTTFPEWWRQGFTGGRTGSEVWVVLADTTGVLDWHQVG